MDLPSKGLPHLDDTIIFKDVYKVKSYQLDKG